MGLTYTLTEGYYQHRDYSLDLGYNAYFSDGEGLYELLSDGSKLRWVDEGWPLEETLFIWVGDSLPSMSEEIEEPKVAVKKPRAKKEASK